MNRPLNREPYSLSRSMTLGVLLIVSQGPPSWALVEQGSSASPNTNASFYRTSFECSKTRDYSVEQAICKNAQLAKLDVEMAEAYRKRLESAAAAAKDKLILSQESWLKVRNSYDVNPSHTDPDGVLSDIADFYRYRIAALRSSNADLLNMKLPPEYDWIHSIVPEGFSKEFSFSRAYMGCSDPCRKAPVLFKVLSIVGSGIGEPPGDISAPFEKLTKKLTAQGWSKCRSADDSGKPTMYYFVKKDKMVAVSTYASMGAGNAITVSVAISRPLPEVPPHEASNPKVTITSDWTTYSKPDMPFEVRYPPGWWVRDDSVPNGPAKSVLFVAKDYAGNFRISAMPRAASNRISICKYNPGHRECLPSPYEVSGYPARILFQASESVGWGTCTRYIEAVDVETENYELTFSPDPSATITEGASRTRLTDLYEKILSTIKVE